MYSLVVTIVYLYTEEPLFHQMSYFILVITKFVALVVLISKHSRKNQPDQTRMMIRLFLNTMVCVVVGFAFWNMDNFICGGLRGLRNQVGYPLRVVFEFHAVWYLI